MSEVRYALLLTRDRWDFIDHDASTDFCMTKIKQTRIHHSPYLMLNNLKINAHALLVNVFNTKCIGCFQRMSQPDISYEDLTKDYPRYPDIYDITTIHSVPEDALMVRLLYQSCWFYKISLGICVPWKQIIYNEPTKQIKK